MFALEWWANIKFAPTTDDMRVGEGGVGGGSRRAGVPARLQSLAPPIIFSDKNQGRVFGFAGHDFADDKGLFVEALEA